jgi:cytochrome c oxidase subunit 2
VWLPNQGSTLATQVDQGWNYAMWVSVIIFAIVMGAMFYFMWRYRRREENERTKEVDHSTKLEIAWSLIPLGILMWLFFVGLRGFVFASVPPRDAYTINVQAHKWAWDFTYPGGFGSTALVVPKGQPVRLVMSSQDVLHSFYIPSFRIKQDVVPGSYSTLWFEATEAGDTLLECAEYCGTNHSMMMRMVKVMEPADFKKWEAQQGTVKDPAALGEELYAQRGCAGCHSLDGSLKPPGSGGPSFKGIFGSSVKLADGSTVVVDEAYIRESVLNPGAKVVAGFPNGLMPVFQGQLKDKQIEGIIAFIKKQK